MKLYELFIDELGQVNPNNKESPLYVLCGCVVENINRNNLKIHADQIKFKYWGRTDIVFHSYDIGKNKKDFEIFNDDEKRKREFLADLYSFLRQSTFSIFIIVIDKSLAKKRGWNSIKVIEETARKLFYHFIVWLLTKNRKGKINIESATAEKDRYYLNEFSYFLSPGCKELTVDYKIIQEMLTSISFVTKRNHDIEEQIADLFAYAARCKYQQLKKLEIYAAESHESKMIKILDAKLFKPPRRASRKKRELWDSIKPFCILLKK